MSQEKVDLRKAAKAGRKKQNKKDKKKKILGRVILAIIVLALLVWIGYSVFTAVKGGSSDNTKQVNLDSLQNYMEEIEDEVDGTDEDTEAVSDEDTESTDSQEETAQ
jgi:cytoskeletal protein RodZ